MKKDEDVALSDELNQTYESYSSAADAVTATMDTAIADIINLLIAMFLSLFDLYELHAVGFDGMRLSCNLHLNRLFAVIVEYGYDLRTVLADD